MNVVIMKAIDLKLAIKMNLFLEKIFYRLFLYYHTMNPGSRCLGSFWVHRVLVSICLGRGKSCGPI